MTTPFSQRKKILTGIGIGIGAFCIGVGSYILSIRKSADGKSTASTTVKYPIFNGSNETATIEQAASVLTDAFTTRTEPACYPLSSRTFTAFVTPYLERAVDDKTTVIARANNGETAGVCLNNDMLYQEEPQFIQDMLDRDYYGIAQLFQILHDLDAKFIKEMKDNKLWKPNTILHLWMIAIHKDYGKRGIGGTMVQKTIEIAKKNGYQYIVAECTNDYSINAMKKHNFQIHTSIEYESWQYPAQSGICPYKGIAKITGFKQLSLMVLKVQ